MLTVVGTVYARFGTVSVRQSDMYDGTARRTVYGYGLFGCSGLRYGYGYGTVTVTVTVRLRTMYGYGTGCLTVVRVRVSRYGSRSAYDGVRSAYGSDWSGRVGLRSGQYNQYNLLQYNTIQYKRFRQSVQYVQVRFVQFGSVVGTGSVRYVQYG